MINHVYNVNLTFNNGLRSLHPCVKESPFYGTWIKKTLPKFSSMPSKQWLHDNEIVMHLLLSLVSSLRFQAVIRAY